MNSEGETEYFFLLSFKKALGKARSQAWSRRLANNSGYVCAGCGQNHGFALIIFVRHLSQRHVDKTSGIFETSEVFHFQSGEPIKWAEPPCTWGEKARFFAGKRLRFFERMPK